MKKMQVGGAKTYTGTKGKTTTTGSIPNITTHKGKKGSTEVVNYYSDNGKVVRHSGSKGKTVIDSTKNFKVKEHEGSKGQTRVFEDKTGKTVNYFSKKKGLNYFKNTDSKGTITYKKGGLTKKK
jgi:hypothetical protein